MLSALDEKRPHLGLKLDTQEEIGGREKTKNELHGKYNSCVLQALITSNSLDILFTLPLDTKGPRLISKVHDHHVRNAQASPPSSSSSSRILFQALVHFLRLYTACHSSAHTSPHSTLLLRQPTPSQGHRFNRKNGDNNGRTAALRVIFWSLKIQD